MATVLRYKFFSVLRHASRTCSLPKTKTLSNTRFLATSLQKIEPKNHGKMTVQHCLLLVENKINTKGRLTGQELDYIVQAISDKDNIKSNQVLLLIRCCGSIATSEKPEIRAAYAEKVWNSVKSSGIALDISHYNAFLKVMLENEQPVSPSEYINTIEQAGLVPNRVTYQCLLTYFCVKGDLAGATQMLEEMNARKFPLNENIFNSLVLGHCVAGDISGAEGVLNIMKEKGMCITSYTYTNFLCGLAVSGNIEKMRAVMKECTDQNIDIKGSRLMDVLYYLLINGHVGYAEELIQQVEQFRDHADLITLQFRLLHKENFEGFLLTLKLLTSDDDKWDKMRLAFRYLGNKADFKAVLKFKDVCVKKGIEFDVVKEVLFYTLMANDKDKALQMIDYLHKTGHRIKDSYFSPLVIHASKDKDLNELLKILKLMSYNYTFNITVDYLSRNVFNHLNLTERQISFVIGGLTTQVPHSVVANAILKSGLQKNDSLYINTYVEKINKPRRIFHEVLDEMAVYLNKKSTAEERKVVYNVLMSWLQERRSEFKKTLDTKNGQISENDLNEELQETIDRLAIKICQNCVNDVIEEFLNLAKTEKFPLSDKMVALIERKLDDKAAKSDGDGNMHEEFEAFEADLKRGEILDGEKPDILQFMQYKKTENLTEMEKIFKENEALQTPFGFRSIVEVLKASNKDDLVKSYLEKYYKKFSQAELITRNMFLESEMIQRGMLTEAIELIGKRKGFYKSSSVMVTEMFIPLLEKASPDEMKKLLNMTSSDSQLFNRQDMLDNLTRRGLDEVAVRLVLSLTPEETRYIDLHKNLIPSLYNKKNVDLMNKLMEHLEPDRDNEKACSDLVFLCVCTGNIAKGRELILSEKRGFARFVRQMPSISPMNRKALLHNSIAILKDSKNWSAKMRVYEYLMVLYKLESESPESALDLWVQLQEENVQPSAKFLNVLAEILTKNNMTVPFEVPPIVDKIVTSSFIPGIVRNEISKITDVGYISTATKNLIDLILQNNLSSGHITYILNKNPFMLKKFKTMFNNILYRAKLKEAYDSGMLMDHLKSDIDDIPQNKIVEELPLKFLVSLCVSPSLNLRKEGCCVVLWAYLQSKSEYAPLVTKLQPAVSEVIQNQNVMQEVLSVLEDQSSMPNIKEIITTLIEKRTFDEHTSLKEKALDILKLTYNNLENIAEDSVNADFSFKDVIENQTEIPTTENTVDSEKPERVVESADIGEKTERTSGAGPSL